MGGRAVLAQLSGGPAPAALPEGGLAAQLFESPWLLVAALVLGAGFVFFAMNAQGKGKQAVRVALAMLGAAALVVVVSMVVTTDRERIRGETARLIEAAVKGETHVIEGMLSPSATIQGAGGPVLDRAAIIAFLSRAEREWIESYRVTASQAVIDADRLGRTQVHVSVRAKNATLYDVPIGSWWRLHWLQSETTGEWKVSGLECLQIDGASPAEVVR